MNLLKIQDMLKGAPDQALVGYVQNPSGQVPTYLALSELQRRKEMRASYQANKPEDKSVAEDLVQETQPGVMGLPAGQPMQQAMEPPPEMPVQQMAQGGLAELDVGDMYDENNYANGGIVAFQEGGTSRLGRWWEGYKQRSQDDLAKQDEIQRLQNEYYSLTIDPLKKTMPGQPEAAAQRQTEIKQRIAELSNKTAPVSIAPTTTTGGPRIDTTELPKSFTGIDSQSQFGPSISAMNQMTNPTAPSAPGVTKPAGPDFGGLYQPLPDYSKQYADLYQDPTGMAEKEMAKYKKLIGEDTMRPELEKKLTKMEERAAKMEEQSPWLALAKAGFEMASARPEYGKGQSAIADIARGAGVGIKDYADARDKLETLRDKQFDVQAKLAQSKRAEDIAAATHGIKSEEFIKAQNQSNKLAELGYKYTRDAANQKNKIDAFEAVNKGKLYGAQAEYYGEKGPSGEITEKDLFKQYLSTGGEYVHGPWETFKTKYAGKAIPSDINNIMSKYLTK
jgi:hypothetical protein